MTTTNRYRQEPDHAQAYKDKHNDIFLYHKGL